MIDAGQTVHRNSESDCKQELLTQILCLCAITESGCQTLGLIKGVLKVSRQAH